jgi:hypothetical protein
LAARENSVNLHISTVAAHKIEMPNVLLFSASARAAAPAASENKIKEKRE